MRNLICFIGLDGSGKTTLANLTLKRLQQENIQCKTVWAKFGLTIYNQSRIKFSKVLRVSESDQSSTYSPANPYLPEFRSDLWIRAYIGYLLFEHWIRLLINVKLPLMLGKTVICDRYNLDTIVDLMVTFGYTYEDAIRTVKTMPRLPKPDKIFYIKISAEKAIERKRDIYNITYLEKRYEAYSLLEQNLDVISIDGDSPVECLETEILKQIHLG